jgi:hypothetical protein
MSKSATGTIEAPGKNVRAKAGLDKSILDQGWSEFRRQLEYTTVWSCGMLLAVPAYNTSRTCPCCRHVAKENRKTQARFACVSCGYENHADVVGAINALDPDMTFAVKYRKVACERPFAFCQSAGIGAAVTSTVDPADIRGLVTTLQGSVL